MSDVHLTAERGSSEATERPEAQTSRDESDAEKAPSCRNHTNLTRHDTWHCWQGACQLLDCRLGLLEGRVGPSCGRSGCWRNLLEEPPSRSKSSAVTLRRHESVAMLPHLLSDLAVTRTRSEPCIFGKNFLRITLPLPGEPSCEANATAANHPESSTPIRLMSCDTLPLIGLETQGASSSASVFTSLTSAEQVCDQTGAVMDLSSKSPYFWDGDEMVDDVVGSISYAIKVSNAPVSSVSFKKPSKEFHGAKSNMSELEQDFNVVDSFSCAAGSQVVASRTSQWDDWWNSQPEEFNVATGGTEQHRNRSKGEGCAHAMVDDLDEDASDEGYLVLDEQEEERPGSCSENEAYHDIGDGSCAEHVPHDAHDYASEESLTDWQSGNLKGYKEDDIWSDEHFVSSQVKGFPPPISILANETHPGLPSHVPKTLWRSVKRNGRFVLQEVQARPREFFRATRECGRLRLQLVRPDSDSTGSYTETASIEDKEGSLISSESVGNFARISEVCLEEDSETATSCAGPSTSLLGESSFQGIDNSQIEDEELRGAAHDCTLFFLSDRHGSAVQQEHSEADTVLGRKTPTGAVFTECTNQMDPKVADEQFYVADQNAMIEEKPGERAYAEGFGRMTGDIMTQELRELDVCNQASGIVHGSDEDYRQNYQHPRFSATYGFDNNLNVLAPSQTLMQLSMQSAVR